MARAARVGHHARSPTGLEGSRELKIVGLTGSIASGKSSAARYLERHGAHLIDADRLGHLAYAPGTPVHRALIDTFGPEVEAEDGRIERRALAARVFGRRDALARLNAIVWPAIRRLAEARIARLRASDPEGVVVLEAAVLLEAGWEDLVDEVWVLLVDPDTALRRAAARDGAGETALRRRIDAQLSNRERARRAQVLIDNNGDPARLEERLAREWQRLRGESGPGR